jgi:hypothetical protein
MRRVFAIACGLWLTISAAGARPSACDALGSLPELHQTGPIFLTSFPTIDSGPLHGVAFLYDNAAATIALIGCGQTRKAAQIGDAMLAALDHDRYWHDGRLRNGYLAGAVTDNPVKLAGWWDSAQNMWVEDRYQVGSDTGNMAWTMLALLALHRAGAGPQYLAGAERIAAYVETSFNALPPAGFSGGTFGHEPKPEANSWKSTEHNTDLAAAFRQLGEATGDAHWVERARQAQDFVAAMWRPDCACFAVGTGTDGQTPNTFLALDAQMWPLLAIPGAAHRYASVVVTARRRLSDEDGYAYSEAKEGVWTEGSAQAALLMSLTGRTRRARALEAAVERNRAPDGSYYATRLSQLPTGFMLQTDPSKPRLYFHIPHLAALSWAALAEQHFNPFTGGYTLPDDPVR